jgi:hypothetical protein
LLEASRTDSVSEKSNCMATEIRDFLTFAPHGVQALIHQQYASRARAE